MTEEKKCLIDAMMLLEIAFFDGGSSDWKNDPVFGGKSEIEMAAMAHALIQFAHCRAITDEYKKAKVLVARIAARLAIEDAQDSVRNASGN